MAQVNPMAKARTKLLLKHPWYGQLVLRLKTVDVCVDKNSPLSEAEVPTAGVDGKHLFYNSKWFNSLSFEEQLFTLAHEVRHCALLHMTRRGNRDPQLWNIAGDLRINLDLTNEKIGTMPKLGLLDPQVQDWTTERIYSWLQKNAKVVKVLLKPSQGQGEGWNFGGVLDAPAQQGKDGKQGKGGNQPTNQPSASGTGSIEQDWKVAVEQANMVARKAGNSPLGADRLVSEIHAPKADWRDALKKYVSTKGDYSWRKPNKRLWRGGKGVYLPSMIPEKVRHVIFALDTSGSIGGKMLEDFASEANGIMKSSDQFPERVTVVYCDAKVGGWHDCESGLYFRPVGGGGTQFQPVFDLVKEEGWEPDVLFYLTDLECFDKPTKPEFDVVWVAPEAYHRENQFGFGEIVYIPE